MMGILRLATMVALVFSTGALTAQEDKVTLPDYQSFDLTVERGAVFDDVFSDGTQYALVYHRPEQPDQKWLQTAEGTFALTSRFEWGEGVQTYFEYLKDGRVFIHFGNQDWGPYDKIHAFVHQDKRGAATLSEGSWSVGFLGEAPIFTAVTPQPIEGFVSERLLTGWASVTERNTQLHLLNGTIVDLPFAMGDANQFARVQGLADGRILFQYRSDPADPHWTLGLWDGATIVAHWPLDKKGSFEVVEPSGQSILKISPLYDGTSFDPPYTVVDLKTAKVIAPPESDPVDFFATSSGQIGFRTTDAEGLTVQIGPSTLTFPNSAYPNTLFLSTPTGSVVWGLSVPKLLKDKKGNSRDGYELFYDGKSFAHVQAVSATFFWDKKAYLVVQDFNDQWALYQEAKRVFGPVDQIDWTESPIDGRPVWFWAVNKGTKVLYKDFKVYSGPFTDAWSLRLLADGTPVYLVADQKGEVVYKGTQALSSASAHTDLLLSRDQKSVLFAQWDGKVGSIFVDGKAVVSGQKFLRMHLLGQLADGRLLWEKTDEKNRNYLMLNDRAEMLLLGRPYSFDPETEMLSFSTEEGQGNAFKALDGTVYERFDFYPLSAVATASMEKRQAAPIGLRFEVTQENQSYSAFTVYDGNKILSRSRSFYGSEFANGDIVGQGISNDQVVYTVRDRLFWGSELIGSASRFAQFGRADKLGRAQIDWQGPTGLYPMIWGRNGSTQDPGRAIVHDGHLLGWVTVAGFEQKQDKNGPSYFVSTQDKGSLVIYSTTYDTRK